MIPLVDLRRQPEAQKEELAVAIDRVIEASAFTLGETVERFETAFAAYCRTEFAVGVGSGTDAIKLALKACRVGAGDEVITTPNTFIATAEAISMVGATPVFVDVKESTLNIDPQQIEAKITAKTKAIVPVHLYGQPAAMDEIMSIAERHGLKVIEDACQAHGAAYKGLKAGAIGHAGCFSFYPSKNLGGYGDGGMVVSDDPLIAESVRLLRSHGEGQKNLHEVVGGCSRLHGLQAAILDVKLRDLDNGNLLRQNIAKTYELIFGSLDDLVTPGLHPTGAHVFHLYVVRTSRRKQLIEDLARCGVGTGIHYPIPIHLQPAYRHLGHDIGDFPVAERAAKEIVSLPIFPQLRDEEVGLIGDSIIKSAGGRFDSHGMKVAG